MTCPTCHRLLAEGRAHCTYIECMWVICQCGDLIDTTRKDDDPTDDPCRRRTTDGPDD